MHSIASTNASGKCMPCSQRILVHIGTRLPHDMQEAHAALHKATTKRTGLPHSAFGQETAVLAPWRCMPLHGCNDQPLLAPTVVASHMWFFHPHGFLHHLSCRSCLAMLCSVQNGQVQSSSNRLSPSSCIAIEIVTDISAKASAHVKVVAAAEHAQT